MLDPTLKELQELARRRRELYEEIQTLRTRCTSIEMRVYDILDLPSEPFIRIDWKRLENL